jgi:ActR/RegA family two-component response regulator
MTRLLLGLLDKGTLRLGDNATVDFQKSLIFFTSNLGAREMMKEISPDIGFQSGIPRAATDLSAKLESIALGAVRKRFSPEFVNRIDAVVTYQPLDAILEHDIAALQQHVNSRLGDRCFRIEVLPEARRLLLESGVSQEYGARELKRTIHRKLTQPLATMVVRSEIAAGALVQIDLDQTGENLSIMQVGGAIQTIAHPTILIIDDNHDLLMFLAAELKEAGWQMLMAEDAVHARRLFKTARPGAVLIDYMLGEDDGLKLAIEFQSKSPATKLVLMTGGGLVEDELNTCCERGIPILFKPFLANEVINLIRTPVGRQMAAVVGSTMAAESTTTADPV